MAEFDEFEFNYEDELEVLYEQEQSENVQKQNSAGTTPAGPSRGIELPSPQLSQIGASSSRPLLNKLLNETTGNKRYASTPFPALSSAQQEHREEDGLRTRKRRLELDLFGEIMDIDANDNNDVLDPNAKKLKNEEERDLELIETILNARKRQHQLESDRNRCFDRLELMHSHKMRNLSRNAPKWPFLKLLRSDQERVYVRFHSEDFETKQINDIKQSNVEQTSIFSDKKKQLWDEAREIINKRVDAQDSNNATNVVYAQEGSLWVEKYKPTKYFELLSDESCNRNLLKWFKLWDKMVFSKSVKAKGMEPVNNKKALNTFNKKTGKFEHRSQLNTELDENHCPVQKVVLLAGPPGFGKTTLANLIAKHAGYQPVEINASDDRTVEAFRLALENGTQMQSVLSASRKPNCIILDEIDGAPAVSIDFLIRFISGSVKSKGKKEKQAKHILRRPIVCICNDLYAVSLRQLRTIAYVINVPAIEASKLVLRLLQICRKQNIKTNPSTLYTLVEKTGNDIR